MPKCAGVIGVPSSAGAFAPGQEKAPAVLRSAGMIERLSEAGVEAKDYGDTPGFRWRPDPDNRFAQNSGAIHATIKAVQERVAMALGDGMVPLVLGGDCTIEIGTVLGHEHLADTLGLLYFDAHPDLNRPVAPGPGALDWTGVAHLLGESETVDMIARAGRQFPMLQADQLYLFGHDPDQQTPLETEAIRRLGIRGTPIDVIRDDPEGAAHAAIARFTDDIDRLLVHFDVDIIDFTDLPISHHAGRNEGLDFGSTMRALKVILASDKVGSVTIAELNPDFADVEGEAIGRFVDRLVDAFAQSDVP